MPQSANTAKDLITVEEFYRLVREDEKADLLDGVVYMASPETLESNNLTGFLYRLLADYCELRGLGGKVLFSRFAFRLSKYRAPEPDVAYVRPERLHLVSQREMKGGPDIAIEVVSRDSVTRDYKL